MYFSIGTRLCCMEVGTTKHLRGKQEKRLTSHTAQSDTSDDEVSSVFSLSLSLVLGMTLNCIHSEGSLFLTSTGFSSGLSKKAAHPIDVHRCGWWQRGHLYNWPQRLVLGCPVVVLSSLYSIRSEWRWEKWCGRQVPWSLLAKLCLRHVHQHWSLSLSIHAS